MSPRSEEFIGEARERLRVARLDLDGGFPSAAVGAAYYAMLYAARGALSELDAHAKTHGGTWSLFHERLVATGRIDRELAAKARRAEKRRYETDYDAASVAPEEAEAMLADAQRFVAAVEEALD